MYNLMVSILIKVGMRLQANVSRLVINLGSLYCQIFIRLFIRIFYNFYFSLLPMIILLKVLYFFIQLLNLSMYFLQLYKLMYLMKNSMKYIVQLYHNNLSYTQFINNHQLQLIDLLHIDLMIYQ